MTIKSNKIESRVTGTVYDNDNNIVVVASGFFFPRPTVSESASLRYRRYRLFSQYYCFRNIITAIVRCRDDRTGRTAFAMCGWPARRFGFLYGTGKSSRSYAVRCSYVHGTKMWCSSSSTATEMFCFVVTLPPRIRRIIVCPRRNTVSLARILPRLRTRRWYYYCFYFL